MHLEHGIDKSFGIGYKCIIRFQCTFGESLSQHSQTISGVADQCCFILNDVVGRTICESRLKNDKRHVSEFCP